MVSALILRAQLTVPSKTDSYRGGPTCLHRRHSIHGPKRLQQPFIPSLTLGPLDSIDHTYTMAHLTVPAHFLTWALPFISLTFLLGPTTGPLEGIGSMAQRLH